MASTTTTSMRGWATAMAGSSSGTSQRPVVPITPEADGAGDVVGGRRDVGDQRVELELDAAGPRDHQLARLGEVAVAAVDEGDLQLLLQAGDVGGDVRLHRVEGPGGGREAAVIGHGGEGGELAEVHRSP